LWWPWTSQMVESTSIVMGWLPGPAPAAPRPTQDLFGGPVELADMPEGEAAQERPQRRGGHDAVAEHLGGGPGAQHVSVVDAVRPSDQRVDQGQHLPARTVMARPLAKVDQLINDRLDAEPLGQCGREQQAGVGDRVVVVERHNKPSRAVGGWHRESALQLGTNGRLSNAILPAQRAFLIIGSCPTVRAAVDPGLKLQHAPARLNATEPARTIRGTAARRRSCRPFASGPPAAFCCKLRAGWNTRRSLSPGRWSTPAGPSPLRDRPRRARSVLGLSGRSTLHRPQRQRRVLVA